ncbi:MAG: hypothetical protein K6E85_15895 [Lachnospiraceae bacterium]|nr:hypothetical protein [Lachnospiraceae bacterium]
MNNSNMIDDVIRMTGRLNGKDEFKTFINNYAGVFRHMFGKVDPECEMFVFRRALLLSIDEGNGYEKLVELYTKLWEGFLDRVEMTTWYHKLKMPDLGEMRIGISLRDAVLDDFKNSLEVKLYSPVMKTVCIDITEWIDKIESDAFRAVLSRLRYYMSNNILIFRVPAVDENTLGRIKEAINWYITTDEVYSPPDSQENYFEYGLKCLEEKEIELDEGAKRVFRELIDQAQKRNDFWGFKTIDRIVDDITIRALWKM